jgi:hypothetical protein
MQVIRRIKNEQKPERGNVWKKQLKKFLVAEEEGWGRGRSGGGGKGGRAE